MNLSNHEKSYFTQDIIDAQFKSIFAKIDTNLNNKTWKLRTVLSGFILLFLFTSPFFNFQYVDTTSWQVIEQQAEHILIPVRAVSESHDAKMTFRLTVPALAWLLRLHRDGLIVLQFIVGFLILYLFVDVLHRDTNSRAVTFVANLIAVSCYFCFSAFYDVFGRVDAFAYLFLLLSVWFKNPLLIFISVFLGSFCDERALINSWFVLVYWQMQVIQPRLYSKYSLTANGMAVILAWVTYAVCRYVLIRLYNFPTETGGIGLSVFLESRHYIPIAVFSTYGMAWWVILAAFGILIVRKQWLLFAMLAAGLGASTIVALLVTDINRSLAYSFPILLISMGILCRNIEASELKKILIVLLLLSMIVPIYIYDSKLHYQPTIVVRLLEKLK
jgi:hypothetical protein